MWLHRLGTHPVCTGLATGLMLSEVSVAGLLGIRESSSNSLEGCVRQGRDPVGKGSFLSGGVKPALLHNPRWTVLYHWVSALYPSHT